VRGSSIGCGIAAPSAHWIDRVIVRQRLPAQFLKCRRSFDIVSHWHVLHGAIIGGYEKTSEQAMFRDLVAQIPDNSLTVLDRNFLSPLSLLALQNGGTNRHWLTRRKSNTKYEVKH